MLFASLKSTDAHLIVIALDSLMAVLEDRPKLLESHFGSLMGTLTSLALAANKHPVVRPPPAT